MTKFDASRSNRNTPDLRSDAGVGDTQSRPQNPDIFSTHQSLSGTALPDSEPSKMIHPEGFCHSLALTDVVQHEGEDYCLARTRT